MSKFIKDEVKTIAISGIRQFDMKAAYVDAIEKGTGRSGIEVLAEMISPPDKSRSGQAAREWP